MTSKMTAQELADIVMQENRPFDYSWLRHIRQTYSKKELREWTTDNIIPFTTGNESKQLIGRAASILLDEVMSEVW